MATVISLAAYLIRVRDLNTREDEVLSEIDGEHDLLDYLNKQLTKMQEMKHNKEHQQVLTVTKLVKDKRRLVGVIETGDYGRETNIYSVVKRRIVYINGKLRMPTFGPFTLCLKSQREPMRDY